MKFTRGGKEQELPAPLAESACPCSHQHSGAVANAVDTELQEWTRSPSTHWSKVGKINVLVSLASVRLKKSSHRTFLIKQLEKEKHTNSFLNKTKMHFTNYWMSLLSAQIVLCGKDAESPSCTNHQSKAEFGWHCLWEWWHPDPPRTSTSGGTDHR